MGLSSNEDRMIVSWVALTQYERVTDGRQTDRHMGGFTIAIVQRSAKQAMLMKQTYCTVMTQGNSELTIFRHMLSYSNIETSVSASCCTVNIFKHLRRFWVQWAFTCRCAIFAYTACLKKLCQLIFSSLSVKYEPISIKIGKIVREEILNENVPKLPTSPKVCAWTTLRNLKCQIEPSTQ